MFLYYNQKDFEEFISKQVRVLCIEAIERGYLNEEEFAMDIHEITEIAMKKTELIKTYFHLMNSGTKDEFKKFIEENKEIEF